MYLAFKWLMLMSGAMWALLCVIDVYLDTNKEIHSEGPRSFTPTVFICKNASYSHNKRDKTKYVKDDFKNYFPSTCILHYLTFCAGALVVSVYNRKEDIISYIRTKTSKTDFRAVVKKVVSDLNQTADFMWVAILKKCNTWRDDSKRWLFSNLQGLLDFERRQDQSHRDNSLLKRLKEVGQERNNLGQLLNAAIQENRNIRTQCQLDNLAKNRLMRQIQDTQKQIKDNRSRYVNFQQLYLVTHQENIFLKCHIKRLTKEKEEADYKLKILINEVLQSNDSNLKLYCTNFLAKSKVNSVFGGANAEVMNLLLKRRTESASTSNWSMSGQVRTSQNTDQSQSRPKSNVLRSEDDELVAFTPPEPKPKLRGLPGECVWTVKDRDGIIEKLYEYDYGYDFDNGDTIRRIREYSVYHDKDCLLDVNSKSATIIHDTSNIGATRWPTQMPSSFSLPSNRNFLTGSPIFQKFMENNKKIVTSSVSPAPPLLCG